MNPPTWDDLFKSGGEYWDHPHPLVARLVDKCRDTGRSGISVLDLGCGYGRHLTELAGHWSSVVGLDCSPQGLYRAQDLLDRNDLGCVSLLLGDMVRLPFSSSCFDAVLSIHVIYHNPIALIRITLEEIYRILKPAGLAALTFQSSRGWRFGSGTQLEPGTFIPDTGLDAGIPHHFFDPQELVSEVGMFTIWSMELEEKLNNEGKRSSHWQVILEKP